MFSNVVLCGFLYFTNITVCWGLCNLCSRENVKTNQSSYYQYTAENSKINLTADRAVNGKFLDHRGGDCAGTSVEGRHNQSWWNISLNNLAVIYKINLMFRENCTRHYGYYVFINKVEVKIEGLTSLTPVYHEEDKEHPGVQNIIMFPGGIQGKQMYIYQNKSNATDTHDDKQNNVLDICEVEIWGCINNTNDENCTCSQDENVTFVPQETLTSVVAWPQSPNKVTLKCHKGNVVLQNDKNRCEFKPKCDLEYRNQSILFFCSACKEVAYNGDTDEQNPRPFYTLNVGDNVTYICKKGYRLAAGNLSRLCQENGSWTGEEPICKPCAMATFNASTTDAKYFQPNDTLNVGDNVTYTCKTGHRLAAGNLTRICQENGSWSGEEPICKPCAMATFNASTTDAQYFQPNDTLTVGDNVTYTCKTGHRLANGSLIRICQENGSWTGEEPICKRCECPCKRLASQNFIKDPIVLQERVEEIKKILEVNRSELSAFKRKKISSYDGRATSTGLGMTLGVGVITFVIGAIVCGDLLTCKGRRRRRAFRKV